MRGIQLSDPFRRFGVSATGIAWRSRRTDYPPPPFRTANKVGLGLYFAAAAIESAVILYRSHKGLPIS